jgi:hypothetical protein
MLMFVTSDMGNIHVGRPSINRLIAPELFSALSSFKSTDAVDNHASISTMSIQVSSIHPVAFTLLPSSSRMRVADEAQTDLRPHLRPQVLFDPCKRYTEASLLHCHAGHSLP